MTRRGEIVDKKMPFMCTRCLVLIRMQEMKMVLMEIRFGNVNVNTWIVWSVVLLACGVCGFLIPEDISLKSHLPKLPQYSKQGKSLVLVGGNLWDNNTEIYSTIIDMAVRTSLYK